MARYDFRWNIDHIAEHGVRPEDVEYVVNTATRPYPERAGERKYLVKDQDWTGRYLQVVYIFAQNSRVRAPCKATYRDGEKAMAPEEASMKKKSYYERFMEMTDAERDAEVAQFDREF